MRSWPPYSSLLQYSQGKLTVILLNNCFSVPSLLPFPLLSPFFTDSALLAQAFLDGLTSYSELAAMSQEDKVAFSPLEMIKIPGFQKILVQQNCHLFGVFSQKYASWEMKRGWAAPSGQTELLFRSTNITGAEFVILKVICLLSPGKRYFSPGERGKK